MKPMHKTNVKMSKAWSSNRFLAEAFSHFWAKIGKSERTMCSNWTNGWNVSYPWIEYDADGWRIW